MKDRINILLVEDSPSDIRLTEEALKDSGLSYQLSIVNDGEEAMDFLKQTKTGGNKPRPDVILLDLNMPKKNGHEVLAEIKEDADLSIIPVVLLTVSQRDHDILEALRLKMNYYLAKPVEAEKLTHLVQAIFELHAAVAAKEGGIKRDDEDLHVRLVLAGNPHTDAVVLRKLATEKDTHIRCRIAENPNTPPDVLLALLLDEHSEVRLSIADNPNTPQSVLEQLSEDKSDDVRLGLAENPHMPSAILQVLAADENIFVASSAAKTLSNIKA